MSEPQQNTPLAELLQPLKHLLRWLPISAVVGILAGTASALLIFLLKFATDTREAHKWIIALLPLAGLAVGVMYERLGTSVEAGNDLLLDEIHNPQRTLPLRMTPLILISTFITHLFGGSAGREGTALQTGASLADQLSRPFRLGPPDRRILLMSGIAAGFGSVFGTPLAGAVFGLEVLAVGSIGFDAIVPCFLAAFAGDFMTRAWGIHHAAYSVLSVPRISIKTIGLAAIAGIVFGLVAMAFAQTSHAISRQFKKRIAWPPLRPFIGGVIIALAVLVLHSTRYIGLGDATIAAAFGPRHDPQDWLLKFLFTALTLGSGFKGGEVTPLFFIGATLGNALAWVLPLTPTLLAAMGFVAVFAGAANTPIACTLMAMELFGAEAATYAAIACVFSYLFSGHAGIYGTQRLAHFKYGHRDAEKPLATSDLPPEP